MTKLLDQDFLIDVSEEDDSLLPNGDKASHKNGDGLLRSGPCSPSRVEGVKEQNAKDVGITEENLPLSQSIRVPDKDGSLALPVMCEVPPVAKKKKSGFNVRKSMAWNSAFLNDEGVLDSEELSLVNKTFPKFSGRTKQSNLKNSGPISSLKPPLVPQMGLGSIKVVVNPEVKDHLSHSNLNSCRQSMKTISEFKPANVKGMDGHMNKAKSSLSHGEGAISKKELRHPDPSKPKPSLDRMYMDKNESAFNYPISKKGTVPNRRPSLEPFANSEATRPSTSFSMNQSASGSILHAKPGTSSLKPPERSSSKAHSSLTKFEAPGAFPSSYKPSGLRMPSPKLGFFDMSTTVPQVSGLHERTSCHEYGGSAPGSNDAAQLEVKERGFNGTMDHSNHTAMPRRLGRELGKTPGNQNRVIRTLTRIPMAPLMHGWNAQYASLQLAPGNESPRPVLRVPTPANCSKQSIHGKKIGNAVKRGMPANSKSKEQENVSPNCVEEDRGMPQKCTVALDRAMSNCSIQGQPPVFKTNEQENLSQVGLDPTQESEDPASVNPTIKANGDSAVT